MPDVGDVPWSPSWLPIRLLVIADLVGLGRVVHTRAMTPSWIVVDAVGWIGDHQMRGGAVE